MRRAHPPHADPLLASGPTPPPPRRSLRTLGTIALIALPIVVAALLLRPRGHGPGTSAPATDKSDRVILDNLEAADARKDWVTTLLWAERLGARRPYDPMVLRARGTAWSNYAVAQRPARALERPALRTSLERADCMRRALGLLDSSATAATTAAMWLEAMARVAELNETLGLPGDALLAYEIVKQRLPDEMSPALRAYWLRALLYDPVHPDTSEWDRRMRSLGRR